MADTNESKGPCDECRWNAKDVAVILGIVLTFAGTMLNRSASLENGEKIEAVQKEAQTVKIDMKERSDHVDKKLEKVEKTTEKTAEAVGAEK